MSSVLRNKTQSKNGIHQPVIHQASVVLNCRGNPNEARDRQHQLSTLAASAETLNRFRTPMCSGMYDIPKHLLAFRELHMPRTAGRSSALQASDVRVWTSFNNLVLRDTDGGEEPVFMGIVDKPITHSGAGTELFTNDLVVALHGSRSTFNSSWEVIKAGDFVAWDYPDVIQNADGTVKPSRPDFSGFNEDLNRVLLVAKTIPVNFEEYGNRDLFRCCVSALQRKRKGKPWAEAIPARLRALRAFIGDILEAADERPNIPEILNEAFNSSGILKQIENAKLLPTDRQKLFYAAMHDVEKDREWWVRHVIGRALNTALPGSQLDLFLDGHA
jgi:hypothetical protein